MLPDENGKWLCRWLYEWLMSGYIIVGTFMGAYIRGYNDDNYEGYMGDYLWLCQWLYQVTPIYPLYSYMGGYIVDNDGCDINDHMSISVDIFVNNG